MGHLEILCVKWCKNAALVELCGSLMQVKGLQNALCSTFALHSAIIVLENFFLSSLSGRLIQVLLYVPFTLCHFKMAVIQTVNSETFVIILFSQKAFVFMFHEN